MTYNKICLMLPTYGRSKTLLPKFLESAEKNSDNICFSLCVNQNDKETINYLVTRKWKFEWDMIYENLPKPNLAVYFNMLYNQSKWKDNRNVVVSMVGDDMEFLTPHWDTKMLELINRHNGVGVFWGDDDFIARERLCVNMFVTRDFVGATERPFMDETFPGDMIDVVWYEVGRITKTLHFDQDIHIKHNHNIALPVEKRDMTHNRLRESQIAGHRIGKPAARASGAKIAETLIKKGLVGTSVC